MLFLHVYTTQTHTHTHIYIYIYKHSSIFHVLYLTEICTTSGSATADPYTAKEVSRRQVIIFALFLYLVDIFCGNFQKTEVNSEVRNFLVFLLWQ